MRWRSRSFEREIEAAHKGPLGLADIERRDASLQSAEGNASVADACHVLGVGEYACCDRELRQSWLCVTFSASPKTVTHACAGALAQSCFKTSCCAGVAARNAGSASGLVFGCDEELASAPEQ